MSRNLGTESCIIRTGTNKATASSAASPNHHKGTDGTPNASSNSTDRAAWMADKQSAECLLCFRAFTLLLRKHHCRKCGILVCSKCSSHKINLPATPLEPQMKNARVCDTCFTLQSSSTDSTTTHDSMSLFDPDSENNSSGNDTAKALRTMNRKLALHEDITAHAMATDQNLALPTFPSYCGLFTSLGTHSRGTSCLSPPGNLGGAIPVGRLYVRVICAVNLPAMNRLMSTSDVFCHIHVGTSKQATKIVMNSINPRWDQEFYFDVFNLKESKELIIRILDWDQLGQNKDMAYLEIPLSSLAHSRKLTRWFNLTNLSLLASKTTNLQSMAKQALKVELQRHARGVSESGMNAPGSKDAEQGHIRIAKPRIQLELQFVYNESAMLWSYVAPYMDPITSNKVKARREAITPSKFYEPPVKFDIDALYSDIFRLLELLQPIIAFSTGIMPVLQWSTPWRNVLLIILWSYICLHPFLFLVFLDLALLLLLFRNRVLKIWSDYHAALDEYITIRGEIVQQYKIEQKKKGNLGFLMKGVYSMQEIVTGKEVDGPALLNAKSQSIFEKINPFSSQHNVATSHLTHGSASGGGAANNGASSENVRALAAGGDNMDSSARAHMNTFVTQTLNGMLTTFGLRGSLVGYQIMLRNFCTLLENFYGLLQWKNIAVTWYIVYGLVGLLVYALFLPQKYLFLLGGTYVICMWTPPINHTIAVVLGVIQYIQFRRARQVIPLCN